MKTDYRTPRKLQLGLCAVLLFISLTVQANASWLLDTERFHMSVHGQTSCLECHENIAGAVLHPDPRDVNRKTTDFFKPETCFACHDEVPDNLEEGIHGDTKIKDREKYTSCLNCHQPHYEMPLASKQDHIEQNKSIPEKPACGTCHEKKSEIPPFSSEDQPCLTCHQSVAPGTEKERKKSTYCASIATAVRGRVRRR